MSARKVHARKAQSENTELVYSVVTHAQQAFRTGFDEAIQAATRLPNPPNVDEFVGLYLQIMKEQVELHAKQWGMQS